MNCRENEKGFVTGQYYGYWAESSFEYSFHSNGIFSVQTGGHIGNIKVTGEYAKIDTIILLHPYTNWPTEVGNPFNKLILDSSNKCLKDLYNNYYCKDIHEAGRIAMAHEEIDQEIRGRILELEKVKELTNVYNDDLEYGLDNLQLHHQGLVLIRNEEYHHYQLRQRGLKGPKFLSKILLEYLVNFDSSRIIVNEVSDDSLIQRIVIEDI